MYLEFEDGNRIRVSQKTIFEIGKNGDGYELQRSRNGNSFATVKVFDSRSDAELALCQIKAALNRGDKVFCL